MLEFHPGPGGLTLVWDAPDSADSPDPARFSPLCGPAGRYFVLAVGDAPLPSGLADGACAILEPSRPGMLRARETGTEYVPEPGDILRLWSGTSLSRAEVLGTAFGTVPSGMLSVDLDAVSHNLRAVRRRLGKEASVAAVVKCDGYGLGAAPLARACLAAGANCLVVTSVREGLSLRGKGIDNPLMVLNFDPREAGELLAAGMEAVVYTPAQADSLARAGRGLKVRARAHLKVDTGLGRYGVPVEEAAALLGRWKSSDALEFVGLMTHLSHANEPQADEVNREQISIFGALVDSLGDLLPPLVHAANSAALARYPEASFGMARTGAALCGIRPYPGIAGELDLRRVICWCARVAQVREVPAGRRVGYGGMFVTSRPSRIATVLAGYGDGYPGGMANRARVLLKGRSAPVVGAVSMDCICVDLTGLDTPAGPGDEVVLLGGNEGAREIPSAEYVSPEEAAAAAGVSPYELVSRIGPRVSRVYRTRA